MKSFFGISLLASTFLVMPASAQSFSNAVFFGDSNSDSGRYFYLSPNKLTPNAKAAFGAFTTNPGPEWSVDLGSRFGIAVTPSAAPGGGNNYAAGGARVAFENPNSNAWSTASQLASYLGSTGGRADPNALYVYYIGVNDLKGTTVGGQGNITIPTNVAAITNLGLQAAGQVTALSNAGARYIVVPNTLSTLSQAAGIASGNGYGANSIATANSRALYDRTVWGTLAAQGTNFIPADFNTLFNTVLLNPGRFGITNTNVNTPACGVVTSPNCGPGNYVVPNADRTYFWADTDGHLSSTLQKLEADYVYSLIVAPSQISFLTESAIQFRRGVTLGIQEQIDITQRRGTPGFNVWFNGDVSSLKMNNSSPGFPGDPSTPVSGTLGGSYTFSNNALIGAAVTLGQFDPTFSSGGGFREQEVAATIFGAARQGSLWANAIMSFGWLKYDVNRVVPLGISFDSNQGSTRGQNFSFAALTGYDFRYDAITHGPVAGVEVQSVNINSFAETGGFTSLAFSNIGRTSTVSALGYRASIDYGAWRPFAQVTWNHEFDDTANRTVTATLTSITAPSYSMPIVQLGRDWASAVVGTTVTLAKDWTGLAAFNAQLGQNGTTNYGGRFGINYAFNTAPVGLPVKAKF